VDILFALVVGQVLDPVRLWAMSPGDHPLPAATVLHLAVALAITLASWLGYHASANRPRFRLLFFNVELAKFALDISMVVVYFLMAAYAVRTPNSLRPETLLVSIAFALYLLWDLAGAVEKRGTGGRYEKAWKAAFDDPARPDVHEDWSPTDWPRVTATACCLALASVVCVTTWLRFGPHQVPTWRASVAVDVILLVLLIGYRWWKDHLPVPVAGSPAAVVPPGAGPPATLAAPGST
jgi:hypothetical protein